jgi:hypothetical protein
MTGNWSCILGEKRYGLPSLDGVLQLFEQDYLRPAQWAVTIAQLPITVHRGLISSPALTLTLTLAGAEFEQE